MPGFLESKFFRFLLVGGMGFLVEAVVLTLASTYTTMGPIWGRSISFPLAVLVTWWLNRRFTFRSRNAPGAEGARYIAVQIAGALTNAGVFVLVVEAVPALWRIPVVPLAFGSLAGLVVNFTLSAKLVFAPQRYRKCKGRTDPAL